MQLYGGNNQIQIWYKIIVICAILLKKSASKIV